jgi:chromosome segregation ATPase
MSRNSVNDIYDPDLYARDGELDDIYSDLDESRDSEDTLGRGSEDTLGYRGESMGPPRSIPPEEMKLRQEIKQLKATEKELREYNRKIILEKRELTTNIDTLLENMTKQNAQIDVLKMAKERIEKEKMDLHSKYEVLKKRVADLTGKRVLQGGTRRKRRKMSFH